MNKLKSAYKFLSPKYQTLFLEYKVDLKPRYGYSLPPNPYLAKIIERDRSGYAAILQHFLKYVDVFHQIKRSDQQPREGEPRWNNGYLPGLDIIALYGLMDFFRPKKYVEVGSGNSTMVARKCLNDLSIQTEITSLDPQPRAFIDALADHVIREPLEKIDSYKIFDQLGENDILFIDSSHRCLPNSDVTVFFLELLPRLKKGVVVHIHDIYLPYDYPQFMCDRFYSEQYLLATWLLAQDRYRIVLPNYFVSEHAELSAILNPIWDHPNLETVERHGGSFWFQMA